ncbi:MULTISPECIES: phosphate signaling complex protein PhoU [Dictyoglomus]|uniref:Phosphate-specific transport system accessory protein PhoU n=1 Tax=Dictyoglomus turgidum (strain DSM 6724 / Z-1310) TaxID=515635 RepID=B8E156_DICTD|nr:MULTISPECIES: phosphate signaling complex protein PhoU [Dictyoglomus]ACK42184.1 phosphate uptake regulator, PhoU [Dictyoglomus turgidum DSM 6724]PNV80272.1 MAG: phosphate transport system regulatory protein PhoU [Dictyoglomus turgidum]HBU32414.1 phosphate transport system regulatory protein PhoU [Dictyoglomus sp.]
MEKATIIKEIESLKEKLLRMGSIVEKMLHKTLDSIKTRDLDLAQEVIETDKLVDDYNWNIENQCIKILSLHQPVAKELRIIASTMKIIKDLERIGDYSVDIAKFASSLLKYSFEIPLADIISLATLVEKMVKDIIRAYSEPNLDQLEDLSSYYNFVYLKYQEISNELLEEIYKNPILTQQIVQLIMISRYLERIADHATNIIELIYYIETGERKELHK